jgi:hypothetical protein
VNGKDQLNNYKHPIIFFLVMNATHQWCATGTTVAGSMGAPGVTAHQLNHPAHLVVDSANIMYVSDSLNHRIQKWSPSASYGTTSAGQANGTPSWT